MKPRPVLVEWFDAKVHDGWHEIDEHTAEGPMLVSSVGYLLFRDKAKVVVALSVDDQNTHGRKTGAADSIAIPASCVKRVRTLK